MSPLLLGLCSPKMPASPLEPAATGHRQAPAVPGRQGPRCLRREGSRLWCGHPLAGDRCLEEGHVRAAPKGPELGERGPAAVGAVRAPAGSAEAATLPQAPPAAVTAVCRLRLRLAALRDICVGFVQRGEQRDPRSVTEASCCCHNTNNK